MLKEDAGNFHLGITLAGAVSAGAYTAGVMDYLIETLEKWQKAKESGHPLAPQHSVTIDMIGGASAGGVTAALALMALYDGIKPVKTPSYNYTQNLLYDSWVIMDDSQGKSTFEKMLDQSDIKNGDLFSLLNAQPIDNIAEKAKKIKIGTLPAYVSKDLNLSLTLSSLRGVPLDISFMIDEQLKLKNYNKEIVHKMYYHKLVAHFQSGKKESNDFLSFDPHNKEDLNRLIECAKATAAFPVGLRSRHIKLPVEFVRNMVKRDLKDGEKTAVNINLNAQKEEYFDFSTVDGGAFNNEPFGEVAAFLEKKYQENIIAKQASKEYKNYGVLMVDPFPNFNLPKKKKYAPQEQIEEVILGIIGAMRNQGMVKRSIMAEMSGKYPRGMIFPTRYDKNGTRVKDQHAIACGLLGGFSGFLSRDFRIHDFFLGRENCRNFLGYFFSLKEKDNHPIHQNWTDEMKKKFGTWLNNECYLPIIPNMDLLEDNKLTKKERKTHQVSYERIKLKSTDILRYKSQLESRVKAMLYACLEKTNTINIDEEVNEITSKVLFKVYRKNWFQSFGSWLQKPFKKMVKNKAMSKVLPKTIVKKVLKVIFEELEQADLLQE